MLVIEVGVKAKQLISSFDELCDDPIANLWLKETYPVFCVVKFNKSKTTPICIALLHKIDYDSCGIFDNPVLLDYIYTANAHRGKGSASALLQALKKNNKIIGFCCNNESAKLFVKCGFSYHPDTQFMVRFPPMLSEIVIVDTDDSAASAASVSASVTRSKPDQLSDESERLWIACKNDGCDDLPDPTNWLCNQSRMRSMWENYKIKNGNSSTNPFLANLMLNNSFSRYMDFMYTNYPAGFGNKLRNGLK